MYPIPPEVYALLTQHPNLSGAELARKLGIPERSASRYRWKFRAGVAVPKTNVSSGSSAMSMVGRWCVFDIETTDLKAQGRKGFMVCCSILPLEAEKPHTHVIAFGENDGDDRRVLREAIKDLSQYDMLIGHNINGFDLNWLDTRRKVHDMQPLRRWYVFDTLHVAQSLGWLTERKSLAFLCDAFNIPSIKTAVYPSAWNEIRSSDEHEFNAARDSIVYHCETDVLSNRGLFFKLWPDSFGLNQPALKRWSRGNMPEKMENI